MSLTSDWQDAITTLQGIQGRIAHIRPEVSQVRLVGGGVLPTSTARRSIIYVRWQMPDGETYTGSVNGPNAQLAPLVASQLAKLHRLDGMNDVDTASAFHLQAPGTPVPGGAVSGMDFVGMDFVGDAADAAMHAHDFTIRRSRDGGWSGCVTIPTRGGEITICASADERAIARALRDSMVQSGYVGDAFADIARGFQQMAQGIAQGRVFDRLGSMLSQAMNDPTVSQVLNIASVIPGVGIGVAAARAASGVIDQLQSGHGPTQERVRQTIQAAHDGDPHAQRATAALFTAAQQRGPAAILTTLGNLFGASQQQGGLQGGDIVNAGTSLLSAASSGYESGYMPRLAAPGRAGRFQRGGFRGASPEIGWDWYHMPAREQASLYSPRQAYLQGQGLVNRGAPVHDIRSMADVRNLIH